MGRITAVSEQPSGGTSTTVVSGITYEPFGPSTGLTYGNGIAETHAFDQDYRLTSLVNTGTNPVQNLTYAYYPTNNVKTITDGVNAADSQSFVYDSLQRLSSATGSYGTYGYTYDQDGNHLTETLGTTTTTYGYGTGNDLLQTISVGGTVTQTIGYTADGRMASFSPGLQSPGGQNTTALSYNQDGQLSAANSGSEAVGSYTYNGFGQRVSVPVRDFWAESSSFLAGCQGRSKRRPLGRSKREPFIGRTLEGISGQEGRWSVAEAAFLPRGALAGRGTGFRTGSVCGGCA